MRAIREMTEALLLALFVFLALQTSIQNFRVEGSSMQPTLRDGEYLMVNKLVYMRLDLTRLSGFVPYWEAVEQPTIHAFGGPERGDVIVFRFPRDPSRDFVKRVIGLPGDTVSMARGQVFINGVPLDEPYITRRSFDNVPSVRLGPDEYYVMGDNRPASDDSRDWGPVRASYIIGKVWFSYWPPAMAFLGR